jgi:hypothetical protein
MYKKMSVDDLTEEYSFRFGKEIHIDFEDIDRQLHLRLLGITKGVWSKQDSISYMNGYLKAMYNLLKSYIAFK